MGVFDKLMSFGEGRKLKQLEEIVKQVAMIEPDYEAMDDAELHDQTGDFKRRYDNGETLDQLLPETFATVREATRRVLGKRHFDVQIMGGAALHRGNIAEMKTGEGKTLVAVLASYLNSIPGQGVHVVTVNDYLAEYQSEQMGRIHHFLGVKVGVILASMTPAQRRQAYAADITYGTNNEFGFDYLRDNMAMSLADCVQRGHNFAIVDEVDSILIDEARTPLIISGPAEDSHRWYPEFAKLVKSMNRDYHYEVDEKKRTISILDPGISVVEDHLGISNLYESANTPLISYLNNAIKAKELFHLDRDYVVANGEVLIVDEFTGRVLVGRRYNEGLHQALEAKEGVVIKDEYQTLATITLQNYFRMYNKLSGMTGTAKTEESEFQKIYGLPVLQIPTNEPMIRIDQPDLIYRTEQAKFDAIVKDIKKRNDLGQPMLVGTASVAKSELLSGALKRAGVKHEVLNAKNHAREAAIVALAGRKGGVTVATNMAGRGTDIILGGNPEFLADAELQRLGLDPVNDPQGYEDAWPAMLQRFETQVAAEHDEVVALGGLYVIGTERHESRRIDNQLRGRSGRQGDPGESRFYLSLQDDLMRLFKTDIIDWVLTATNTPDDVPLEHKQVSRAIQDAQKQVEAQNFDMRKNVLKYDDVMNRQRHAIYGDRRKVLEGADVEQQLRETVASVVESIVRARTEGFVEDWDLDALWAEVKTIYPVGLSRADYGDLAIGQDELVKDFRDDVSDAYDKREQQLGEETMREFERQVLLTVLDRKWREHLYEMDYLREGIGLRAMAQSDPLVEYQREGGSLFNTMMDTFREEVAGFLFNLEVQVPQPMAAKVGLITDASGELVTGASLLEDVNAATTDTGTAAAAESPDAQPTARSPRQPLAKGLVNRPRRALSYSAPSETGGPEQSGQQIADLYAGVGRNAKCPCGSGKKFKQCHGMRG